MKKHMEKEYKADELCPFIWDQPLAGPTLRFNPAELEVETSSVLSRGNYHVMMVAWRFKDGKDEDGIC